ncbi:hypothetical protein BGZ83_009831 [Gryganskiella cystojenkinii]|nr:hypothetical protein BGZ83_009831 [Gryganskiella cystojenkinii]
MEKSVDLPEIITHIAKYLNRHSLATACRVNRRWYESLHLQLWSDIKLDCSTSSSLRPTPDQIQDHLQRIRHLELSAMPSTEFTLFQGATHLRTLIYDNMWEQFQTTNTEQKAVGPWPTLSNLVIHSGSTLKEISILTQQLEESRASDRINEEDWGLDEALDSEPMEPQFWRSAADHCHDVKRLTLRYVHISIEDAPAFWTVCARKLERLHLARVHLPSLAPVLATLYSEITDNVDEDLLLEQQYPKMTKIREITFYGVEGLSPRKQVLLWQACPSLRTLNWDGSHRREKAKFASETFAEALAEKSWPFLESISIYCEWITAEHVAAILNSTRTLRFLRLSPVQFGSIAFCALNQPHYAERMETLILTSPDALDHDQTLTILETFRSLKTFRGGRICLNRIELDGPLARLRDMPWTCKSLEVLSIDICEEIPPINERQANSDEEEEEEGNLAAEPGSTLNHHPPLNEEEVLVLSPEPRLKTQRLLLLQLSRLTELQEAEFHSIKDWERAPRRRRTSLLQPEVLPYRRPSPLMLCFEKPIELDTASKDEDRIVESAVRELPAASQSTPKGGLAYLKNWKRMRLLRFQGQQDLSAAEIRWMKENWPRIWIVEGPLHSDRRRHEKLVEYMESQGILRF